MPVNLKSDLGDSQELVNISDIHDNTVILKDGSIRQIIMVSGINFALKSQEEQDAIILTYQNFLNSLDFPLHVVIHSRKINIEKYLNHLVERENIEASPILQNQAMEYREFIKEFVNLNAIMEKIFLVVVPWFPKGLNEKTKSHLGSAKSFFGGKKEQPADEKEKEEEKKELTPEEEKEEAELALAQAQATTFKEELPQLKLRVEQVVEGLSSIGLESLILDDDGLAELFYNLYNPESIEREGISLQKDSLTGGGE